MRRRGDAVDGVMLLDKPLGLSSNRALQTVRRLLNAQKAGHTGTLDPLATGLLPLCFGNATKFSADLLHADKRYEARVMLGVETATGDAEGEVTAKADASHLTFADLEAVLGRFRGEIEQIPPMYSALKRDGECLYEIARRGETVEREPRRVTIHELSVSDWESTEDGVWTLRRTGVGDLRIDEAVSWETLEKATTEEARALLSPVDRLLSTLPRIELSLPDAERFRHGQRIALGSPRSIELLRVYAAGELLGTARTDERGTLHPVRLLAQA